MGKQKKIPGAYTEEDETKTSAKEHTAITLTPSVNTALARITGQRDERQAARTRQKNTTSNPISGQEYRFDSAGDTITHSQVVVRLRENRNLEHWFNYFLSHEFNSTKLQGLLESIDGSENYSREQFLKKISEQYGILCDDAKINFAIVSEHGLERIKRREIALSKNQWKRILTGAASNFGLTHTPLYSLIMQEGSDEGFVHYYNNILVNQRSLTEALLEYAQENSDFFIKLLQKLNITHTQYTSVCSRAQPTSPHPIYCNITCKEGSDSDTEINTFITILQNIPTLNCIAILTSRAFKESFVRDGIGLEQVYATFFSHSQFNASRICFDQFVSLLAHIEDDGLNTDAMNIILSRLHSQWIADYDQTLDYFNRPIVKNNRMIRQLLEQDNSFLLFIMDLCVLKKTYEETRVREVDGVETGLAYNHAEESSTIILTLINHVGDEQKQDRKQKVGGTNSASMTPIIRVLMRDQALRPLMCIDSHTDKEIRLTIDPGKKDEALGYLDSITYHSRPLTESVTITEQLTLSSLANFQPQSMASIVMRPLTIEELVTIARSLHQTDPARAALYYCRSMTQDPTLPIDIERLKTTLTLAAQSQNAGIEDMISSIINNAFTTILDINTGSWSQPFEHLSQVLQIEQLHKNYLQAIDQDYQPSRLLLQCLVELNSLAGYRSYLIQSWNELYSLQQDNPNWQLKHLPHLLNASSSITEFVIQQSICAHLNRLSKLNTLDLEQRISLTLVALVFHTAIQQQPVQDFFSYDSFFVLTKQPGFLTKRELASVFFDNYDYLEKQLIDLLPQHVDFERFKSELDSIIHIPARSAFIDNFERDLNQYLKNIKRNPSRHLGEHTIFNSRKIGYNPTQQKKHINICNDLIGLLQVARTLTNESSLDILTIKQALNYIVLQTTRQLSQGSLQKSCHHFLDINYCANNFSIEVRQCAQTLLTQYAQQLPENTEHNHFIQIFAAQIRTYGGRCSTARNQGYFPASHTRPLHHGTEEKNSSFAAAALPIPQMKGSPEQTLPMAHAVVVSDEANVGAPPTYARLEPEQRGSREIHNEGDQKEEEKRDDGSNCMVM